MKVGRIVAHLHILGRAPYAFPLLHRHLAQGFSQSTAVANHFAAWGFLLSKSGVDCISIGSIALDCLGHTLPLISPPNPPDITNVTLDCSDRLLSIKSRLFDLDCYLNLALLPATFLCPNSCICKMLVIIYHNCITEGTKLMHV